MPAITSTKDVPTRILAGKPDRAPPGNRIKHPIIGRLVEVAAGRIIVSFVVAGDCRPRRATDSAAVDIVGKEVVLIFASDGIAEPIILRGTPTASRAFAGSGQG